ncbi:MAG: YjfB family protein [Lachnospiraceae bacterium]|nr:YjfB family protein [Lachnospiraceae bacterium]
MDLSMGMDIAAYSMANSQNQVMSGVGVAVLKNVMDMQEMVGAELTQLMEQSVNPNLGANIDIRI